MFKPLVYPEPSHDMLFGHVAEVPERVRENFAEAVRLLDGDPKARLEWIADQPAWQDALRHQHAGQFESLTDFWLAGLDYLGYCLDADSPPVLQLEPSVKTTLTNALGVALVVEHGNLQRVELNSEQYSAVINALLAEQRAVEDGLPLSLTHSLETGPS